MVTQNRFELPVVTLEEMTAGGEVPVEAPVVKSKPRRAARKGRAAPVPVPVPVATPEPVVSPAPSGAKSWATFGVVFTLVLSAALNGYANAQHAPEPGAGWLMGIAVPILVLVLSKVAGEKYRVGQKAVAGLAGGSGGALLFLSVWHCANSIALLTGSGLFLAIPLV